MAVSPTAAQVTQVTQLYTALFGRAPDSEGLGYWVQKLVNGSTITQVADTMYSVEPARVYYPLYYTNEQIVSSFYTNVLGRTADDEGKAYWTAKLSATGATVGSVINDMIVAVTSYTGTDTTALTSQSLFNNKVAVGEYYGATLQGNAAGATAAISAVTATTDVSTAAAKQAAITAGGATSGSTFTLTENVDTVVGNATNNTIDGSLKTTVAGRLQTWNNADQIDGGAGTDTLFAQLTANVSAAGFKGIEVLDIEAQANNLVVDLNAAGDALLTTIKSQNSGANNLTVQNVQSAPTNLVLANDSGNFTLSVANAKLAGAADAVAVDLNNVTAGTVTLQTATAANGYETITVNSNGTVANVLTSLTDGVATGLTTVNVAGAQALTLPLADTSVTTVNASTMTGVLTLTVAAGNTQNMTITGGTANDVINMNGTYTNLDVINGGAGTDRLGLTSAEIAAATTAQSNVTNVETIGLVGAAGANTTYAINNFGATGLRFDGTAMAAGTLTVGYAAGTNSLDLQTSASGGAVTVNVAGTATTDVLNVTAGSLVAGNTFGANNLVINGAETVNLLSQGGPNTFGAAFTITDTAANQALNITGNQNITFTGAVRADSVNASGMTGTAALALNGGTGATATSITGTGNADTLIGSTAGDIINGGAGADTIATAVNGTAAGAADVLTGGDGFDTFILRGDVASGALSALYSTAAQITDFTVGSTATTTDILQLSANNANYAGNGTNAAGIAAAAAGATAIQTVAQNAAPAAYVTGTDLIKLTTGVATTGLTLQTAFNAAIGTGTVTTLGGAADIFVSFYDSTNSKMVIGLVDSTATTAATLESGDTITLVGTIAMSAADYAAFNANNLSIIAA